MGSRKRETLTDVLMPGPSFDPDVWDRQYRERSSRDFMLFARGLVIPSAGGPRLFADCIEPFQVGAFEALAPSLLAIRDGRMPPRRRFWIERTKKAGKDADLAICLVWVLAFAERPFKGQVCAANQTQSGIVRERIVDLIHYNPWLNDLVELRQHVIRNRAMPDSVWVKIEATDSSSRAGGAHGQTPDLLVLNELVHVARWATMEAHMADAGGVPRGVVVISTNAGIKGSDAWRWRLNALGAPDRWTVLEWKAVSPWVDPADVDEARRLDPLGAMFARLWLGEWVSGSGGAVSQAALDRCFKEGLGPSSEAEDGWIYLAGVDLGVKNDHAGVALLGVDLERRCVRVCWVRGFVPDKVGDRDRLEVDIDAVEAACLELHNRYPIDWFGYDPAAGGSFMAQRLRAEGLPMCEVSFASAVNQTAMATSFALLVESGRLECYEDGEGRLRRDFGKFGVERSATRGYKLTAVSDIYGHADVGVAVVMCLPQASEMLKLGGAGSRSVAAYNADGAEPTRQEIEGWPEPIRELIEQEGRRLPGEGGRDDW